METIKALIVEDNVFMADLLNDMLQQYTQTVTVLDIANSGAKALKLIANTKPDVVFLDVELPDMTSFELLNRLPEINFKTIFTTAHSHYAIKAFRVNAVDYLVKPIKEEELREAINRISRPESNKNELRFALKNLNSNTSEPYKLELPTQKGTLRFNLKQITHLEGERNYSYIHLSNGTKVLSSKNLAYFENILVDKGFFRCHRSFLVNGEHIKSINMDEYILKSDLHIPIARRKKLQARDWLI